MLAIYNLEVCVCMCVRGCACMHVSVHVCGRAFVNHMPNFCLIGSLISFWQAKHLTSGVAMTKLHPLPDPYVVNNDHPGCWGTHKILA